MALPDFFVIGAPKAGTTAVHAALARHPHGELQRLARTYRAPEAHPLDPREQCESAGVLGEAHRDKPRRLGQRLDDQHAGGDRIAREMAREKRHVVPQCPTRPRRNSRDEFENLVDEQKGVPMREQVFRVGQAHDWLVILANARTAHRFRGTLR